MNSITRMSPSLWTTAVVLSTAWLLTTPLQGAESEHWELTISFYRELAEQGSPDAQLTLGDTYAQGRDVPQDLIEAYAWYYVAAQQGIEEAIGPMNDVLRALPKDRWNEAKQRAEDYEQRFVHAHR